MTSTADRAYGIATAVLRASAAVDVVPSVCEPERLAGRCSGRVRLILREDDAPRLATVLVDYSDRFAEQ